ncbi:MAG: hypothetical protein WB511_13385 [Nitrososphaeraceae archaeon]
MTDNNLLVNKSNGLSSDFQRSPDTIKIALNILGAINSIFASGTREERKIIKKILELAQERT